VVSPPLSSGSTHQKQVGVRSQGSISCAALSRHAAGPCFCYVLSSTTEGQAVLSSPRAGGVARVNKKKNGANRPNYIAFRVPEGGRFVEVIAAIRPAIRPGEYADLPWAFWYSTLAPSGEFKRAPRDYMRLGIDEPTAKRMIQLMKRGKSLPREFIERILIL
jgi:hypothetical protein